MTEPISPSSPRPTLPVSFFRTNYHVHENGVWAEVRDAGSTDRELVAAAQADTSAALTALDEAVAQESDRLSKELPEAISYGRLLRRVKSLEATEEAGKKSWADATENVLTAIREGTDQSKHTKKQADSYDAHSKARLLLGNLAGPLADAQRAYQSAYQAAMIDFLEKRTAEAGTDLDNSRLSVEKAVVKGILEIDGKQAVVNRAGWFVDRYSLTPTQPEGPPAPEPVLADK